MSQDSTNAQAQSDRDLWFEGKLVEIMPFLNRLAFKFCRDHELAEDLAQEALAKAWRSRESFRTGTNFNAWITTILRNEFWSNCRRSWRQVPWDEKRAENILVEPDEHEPATELQDVVRAMERLPQSQCAALVMIVAGGMTYKQAGKLAHCPAGTIKSRVTRARMALRSAFETDRFGKFSARQASPALAA